MARTQEERLMVVKRYDDFEKQYDVIVKFGEEALKNYEAQLKNSANSTARVSLINAMQADLTKWQEQLNTLFSAYHQPRPPISTPGLQASLTQGENFLDNPALRNRDKGAGGQQPITRPNIDPNKPESAKELVTAFKNELKNAKEQRNKLKNQYKKAMQPRPGQSKKNEPRPY